MVDRQEIQKLHKEIWGEVKAQLPLDTSRAGTEKPPYLWYGSPITNFDLLSKDVTAQMGTSIDPGLRRIFTGMVEDKKRIGLTLTMVGKSQVCLPGIVFSEDWERYVSHPDRILLQENINNALNRSSTLYQMPGDTEFFVKQFGRSAHSARNMLAIFTENVGTAMTDVLQKRLGIPGKYLVDREFVVDTRGESKVPVAQQGLVNQLGEIQFTQTLYDLIDEKRFNPANQARELFAAWWDELSVKNPQMRGRFQIVKKQILALATNFNGLYPFFIMKDVEGNWARVRNK